MYPNNNTMLKQYESACPRQKTASRVETTGGVCLIDRPRCCGCLIRRRKSEKRNLRGNEVHRPGQLHLIVFGDQCMIIITAERTLVSGNQNPIRKAHNPPVGMGEHEHRHRKSFGCGRGVGVCDG